MKKIGKSFMINNQLKAIYKRNLFAYNCYRFSNLISVSESSKLPIESTIFIDCRSAEEYKKNHIKNAVNISILFTYLSESTPEGMEKMKTTFEDVLQNKGITGKEHLVFYEDHLGTLKGVSCRGYYLLSLFGYDENKCHILNEGLKGWTKNNLPTEQGEEAPRQKSNFKISYNKSRFIDYESLNKEINSKDSKIKLLDVRDLEEWKGDSSSPYGPNFTPRKGRIPSAKHVLWTDLMNKEGTEFADKNVIESLVTNAGVKSKDDEIVVYCFKGCRSANSLVALKEAGYKNVKNYLGSWNEWSRNMNLKVDERKL